MQRISSASDTASQNVELIAVSKKQSVSAIKALAKLGQVNFGENYCQEGLLKKQSLQQDGLNQLVWHFIGPVQSNKTKDIANNFEWVHTLDRAKIARRLNQHCSISSQRLNVLVQVNIDNESSKSGVTEQQLSVLVEIIIALPFLTFRGLMCIPKQQGSFEKQSKSYQRMFALFSQLQKQFPTETIDTLSMGMSSDMEAAVEAGSTMVRIGTDLFGKRH